MPQDFEKFILQRLEQPGWITSRGVLRDPTGQAEAEEYDSVEEVMKEMAEKGLVSLWILTLDEDGKSVLAAARPEMDLEEELRNRNASARAVRFTP